MKFIPVQNETLMVGENEVLVSSHESAITPGQHIVKVFVADTELCMVSDSRGQALVELGDFLKDLGVALRKMALVQEGCTGLTVGDLYKP